MGVSKEYDSCSSCAQLHAARPGPMQAYILTIFSYSVEAQSTKGVVQQGNIEQLVS